MQTSRELINNLLRRKSAERMGLYELIWEDTLKAWAEQGYPTDVDSNPVDVCDHFGYDMVLATDWWDIMPIRGCDEVVEETEQWHVKRNGAGASLKFWKNKSGTPEHIAFKMTNRKIWEQEYRSHLLKLDPERINIEFTREQLEKRRQQGIWACYGHMFVFENLRQSIGDICLYESVLLDPDWIHDYNRVYTDFFKMHYKYLFDNAGVPDGVFMFEDLGYKNTTFCDPKIYDTLFFPYYAELIDFFKSYDLPVGLHSCGFIEELVPRFIELGFDALNPMEVKAGCDLIRLAQQYADKIAFVGGFDERILETGDRNLIKTQMTNLMNAMKKCNARYIFASDHSISTNVKYDDYKYAIDVFRENCYY